MIFIVLTQLAEFYLQNSQKQPKFEVWQIFTSLIFSLLQKHGHEKVVCSPRIISYNLVVSFFCCIFAASKLYSYVYKANR